MKALDLTPMYYQIRQDGDLLPQQYESEIEARETAAAAGYPKDAYDIVPVNKFDKPIERGWFWPTAARKCHFDRGDGYALCGKWGRFGFGGRAAPLQGGAESPATKDDCVACRRKLEAGQ